MKRRKIIVAACLTVLAPTRLLFAQRKSIPEIGVLMADRAADPVGQTLLAALKSGLEAFGWKEPDTIHIYDRWGEADDDRLRAHAAELVRLNPKLILTYGAPAIVALKNATSTIPIVFAGSSDPVEAGLVSSLAQPGGNITGFSHFDYAYGTKWVDYLKQIAPEINRLIVLERPVDPSTPGYLKVIEQVAHT